MASVARASQSRWRSEEERSTHEERKRAAGGVHRCIVSGFANSPAKAACMMISSPSRSDSEPSMLDLVPEELSR